MCSAGCGGVVLVSHRSHVCDRLGLLPLGLRGHSDRYAAMAGDSHIIATDSAQWSAHQLACFGVAQHWYNLCLFGHHHTGAHNRLDCSFALHVLWAQHCRGGIWRAQLSSDGSCRLFDIHGTAQPTTQLSASLVFVSVCLYTHSCLYMCVCVCMLLASVLSLVSLLNLFAASTMTMTHVHALPSRNWYWQKFCSILAKWLYFKLCIFCQVRSFVKVSR